MRPASNKETLLRSVLKKKQTFAITICATQLDANAKKEGVARSQLQVRAPAPRGTHELLSRQGNMNMMHTSGECRRNTVMEERRAEQCKTHNIPFSKQESNRIESSALFSQRSSRHSKNWSEHSARASGRKLAFVRGLLTRIRTRTQANRAAAVARSRLRCVTRSRRPLLHLRERAFQRWRAISTTALPHRQAAARSVSYRVPASRLTMTRHRTRPPNRRVQETTRPAARNSRVCLSLRPSSARAL